MKHYWKLIRINLFVFIEGFYIGNGTMHAILDPVSYPGICDSLTVELHSSQAPYVMLYSSAGVIDVNGYGSFLFPSQTSCASYYLVLKLRNSLETWSNVPISFGSYSINLDFTQP